MRTPTPFQVSPEAQDCVRQILRSHLGMEAVLILIVNWEEQEENGPPLKFSFEHFMIGFYPLGTNVEGAHFNLVGAEILIPPDALDRLKGKTLVLKKLNIRADDSTSEVTRELLVAA